MQVVLAQEFRRYLVAEGIVSTPPATDAPPLVIAAEDELPVPGTLDVASTIVAGVRPDGKKTPRSPFETHTPTKYLMVQCRARNHAEGEAFMESIRAAIDGNRGWKMADAYISQSLVVMGPEEIEMSSADSTGYLFAMRLSFLVRASMVR